MIPETGVASASPEGVKRVVFCTGKVYYELTRERKNRGMEATVAITRVEQVKACQPKHTSSKLYLRLCPKRKFGKDVTHILGNVYSCVSQNPFYALLA